MEIVNKPIIVKLVALPDSTVSPLSGLYEALNSFELLCGAADTVPKMSPFQVEIVAPSQRFTTGATGLPLAAHKTIAEIDHTDLVIVPSLMVADGEWGPGRYPEVVDWLRRMHEQGAVLCSSCSGVLLLAETGLLDGYDATVHWAYADTFQRNFPKVQLRIEEVLITTGEREDFVMSGAASSWHDLLLYLIVRYVGPAAAQAIAKFMLFQWHGEGQAPFAIFDPPRDHSDAVVLDVQNWLQDNFAVANPVEEMVRRSGLVDRSFKRRFTKATGQTAISYVQNLRVEQAKYLLECTDTQVDEISWKVGYEDSTFFRRLFKRITGITPSAYRRKFKIPDLQLGRAGAAARET